MQADRFRHKVTVEMARLFSNVDILLVPSLRDEMLIISNCTGHPSMTLRGVLVAYEAQVVTGTKKSEVQVGPDGKPLRHKE